MRISDLQKVWIDSDAAADHASILWDSSLEEAYVNLRRAAGRVLTVLGQERTLSRLLANARSKEEQK